MIKIAKSYPPQSKYRGRPSKVVAHLSRALRQDDRAAFPRAVIDVVREYGVSAVAEHSGQRRETIYRALNGKQKPTFYVLISVLAAIGVKLTVEES